MSHDLSDSTFQSPSKCWNTIGSNQSNTGEQHTSASSNQQKTNIKYQIGKTQITALTIKRVNHTKYIRHRYRVIVNCNKYPNRDVVRTTKYISISSITTDIFLYNSASSLILHPAPSTQITNISAATTRKWHLQNAACKLNNTTSCDLKNTSYVIALKLCFMAITILDRFH